MRNRVKGLVGKSDTPGDSDAPPVSGTLNRDGRAVRAEGPGSVNRANGSGNRSRTNRDIRPDSPDGPDGSGGSGRPSLSETILPYVTPGRVVLLIALLVFVVFAVRMCSSAATINVQVNGSSYTIHGAKTVQTAIRESGIPINPGDLISLKGTVLKSDAGQPFAATVNGEPTTDPDWKLRNGDVVTVTDGDDIIEDYDAVQEPIAFGVETRGQGAIRTFSDGKDGVLETRTGKLSGDEVQKTVVSPTDLTRQCVTPNVGGDKVIALTFDGGPNGEYTTEILDILEKNGARATFFCTPDEIGWEDGPDIIRRARSMGCQIGLYGYYDALDDDAEGMSRLSGEDQAAIIKNGKSELASVLGGSEDYVVRLPYGYIFYDIPLNVKPYIDVEVGWDLDTGDWTSVGAGNIYETLMQAEPGNIVRCHDGSGDRTATIEALKRAIPMLALKGYSFVTVDELRAYL